MKTFLSLAQSRHSVRSYKSNKVEQEKLNQILEAGRIAPSAVNKQPSRFLVLNDEAAIKKLQNACKPHGSPLVIIVCANKKVSWVRQYDSASMVDIDATIATDQMMMCAQDLGLSSCWLTYFKSDVLKKEFNIPEDLVPVNILEIGYSNEALKSPDRFDVDRNHLSDVVTYNSY